MAYFNYFYDIINNMPNEQLKEYIKKAKEAGQNDEKIRRNLLSIGWKENDIEQYLKSVTNAPTYTALNDAKKKEPFLSFGKFIIVLSIVFFILITILVLLQDPNSGTDGLIIMIYAPILILSITMGIFYIFLERAFPNYFKEIGRKIHIIIVIGVVSFLLLTGLIFISFLLNK